MYIVYSLTNLLFESVALVVASEFVAVGFRADDVLLLSLAGAGQLDPLLALGLRPALARMAGKETPGD
jgi:hypothetical protein